MRIINLLKYIFVLCPVLLFAQNYHPLLKENRTWDDWSDGHFDFGSCDSGSRIFITGDTSISNTVYKKLSYQPIFMEKPWPVCENLVIDTTSYPISDMFLREDTVLKQVFIISEQNNYEEKIIYDFSLSVGDTVKSIFDVQDTFVLKNIDSVQLMNGQYRKRFLFSSHEQQGYYIEGIGGRRGLLNDILDQLEVGLRLKCVKDNNVLIWRWGQDCECDYQYVATKDVNNEKGRKFQMYFQSAQNQIVVKSNIKNDYHFKLYDLLGKTLIDESLSGLNNSVNIQNLNTGLYIGVILQNGVLLGSKKILVEK